MKRSIACNILDVKGERKMTKRRHVPEKAVLINFSDKKKNLSMFAS